MLGKDEYSSYLKAAGLTDTQSETTRETYVSLYQGERHRDVVRTDGGPEFKGEFHAGFVKDKTVHDWSHAVKPSTNTRIERYVRVGVEGTRVSLLASGLAYPFWLRCY